MCPAFCKPQSAGSRHLSTWTSDTTAQTPVSSNSHLPIQTSTCRASTTHIMAIDDTRGQGLFNHRSRDRASPAFATTSTVDRPLSQRTCCD
jgi:hypothetical protein